MNNFIEILENPRKLVRLLLLIGILAIPITWIWTTVHPGVSVADMDADFQRTQLIHKMNDLANQ